MTNFDPEKVVMGGGVINGGEIVLETVKKVVAERCLNVFVENCSIEKAKLGGQAGVLGAAALAITEKQDYIRFIGARFNTLLFFYKDLRR